MYVDIISNISKESFRHSIYGKFKYNDTLSHALTLQNNYYSEAIHRNININLEFIDRWASDVNGRIELLYLDPISMINIIRNRHIYKTYEHRLSGRNEKLIKLLKNSVINKLKHISNFYSDRYYACNFDEEWVDHLGCTIFLPEESTCEFRLTYYILYSFALICGLDCKLIDLDLLECKVKSDPDKYYDFEMNEEKLEPEINKLYTVSVEYILAMEL